MKDLDSWTYLHSDIEQMQQLSRKIYKENTEQSNNIDEEQSEEIKEMNKGSGESEEQSSHESDCDSDEYLDDNDRTPINFLWI